MSGWEVVGEVCVDSGQLLITDPCYLEQWKGHDFTSYSGSTKEYSPTKEYSYNGACTATLSEKSAGVLGNGLGAAFSTGYGDGSYTVKVKRDGGRIMAMMIEFD